MLSTLKTILLAAVGLATFFAILKFVILVLVASFTVATAVSALVALVVILFVAWVVFLLINAFFPGGTVTTRI